MDTTRNEVPLRWLRRLAVAAAGRRGRDPQAFPTVDEAIAGGLVAPRPHGGAGAGSTLEERRRDVVFALDHAGPAAARWSTDRPVGIAAAPEVTTGRIPRALDDAGWQEVGAAFAAGAARLRAHGHLPLVALDADGLLHGCVSPLVGGTPDPARALAVLRACAPCDVLVVVEDLAPGGLDPTAGVAFARQAVVEAQAATLWATAGTAHLAPLQERRKGGSADDVGHFLASAAWCVGRVGVPIVAVGHSVARDDVLRARAATFGLAGVARIGGDDIGASDVFG
jgi:hypothetical protein